MSYYAMSYSVKSWKVKYSRCHVTTLFCYVKYMSCYLIWCHVDHNISSHEKASPSHIMSFYVILGTWHVMSSTCHVISCQVILVDFMLRHVEYMLCHGMSRTCYSFHVMSSTCHINACYVKYMPFPVMLRTHHDMQSTPCTWKNHVTSK